MGGGGALFDMGDDGDLDLFLLQGGTDPSSPRAAQAGDVDLYVSQQGSDALFLNGGDGRFQNATVEWSAGVEGWSTSAAFGDLDTDGDLDLYVAQYIELDPKGDA